MGTERERGGRKRGSEWGRAVATEKPKETDRLKRKHVRHRERYRDTETQTET